MSRVALTKLRTYASYAAVAVCGLAVAFNSSAQSVTITDVPEAVGDTIVVFTPGGAAPSTKLIEVDAQTTGPIAEMELGINGSLIGPDTWSGPVSAPMFFEGGGSWSGTIDIGQEPNLTPNAINAFTLRAFGTTGTVSGYDASSSLRASVSGFDAFDAVSLFLDIRDSSTVDDDQNGIPGAIALSGVAGKNGGPVDFEIYPDPDDPDGYVTQRRVQSLDQGDTPTFIIVSKQAVIDFQIYDILVSTPNLAWFKSNFSGIASIFNALNAVLVVRAEPNPRFVVDNFPENPVVDPSLLPRLDIIDEFGGANEPFIFISLTIFLETSPGVWTELDLADTAPLFIQVRSIQMNGGSNFQVSRYATTGVQGAAISENLYVVGDGTGWTTLPDNRVVGPTFNGSSTSITINESVRSATYGVYYNRTGRGGGNNGGGGGGGGGGCFVATAVYGTPMAEEVESLRTLRDAHLLNNALGSAFVDTYYRISPALANVIAERPVLRSISRAVLAPIVALASVPRSGVLLMAALGVLALIGRVRQRRLALRRIDRG